MKLTKPFLALLILVGIFQSCKNEKQIEVFGIKTKMRYLQLEKAKWFMGTWENNTKEMQMKEIWTQKNDSCFSGESFVIAQNDTVFYEAVDMLERNDSLFYIVSVKGENKEKPVSFYMTTANEKEVVFENPKHNFPTKISYTKITNDSIVATISGIQNGKGKSESFPMKKSK